MFRKSPKQTDSNFRTLHLADLLYNQIYELKLPYYLKDQLRRASSSVVLNLVEGNARRTRLDKRRMYNYAHASAKEVQACLLLAKTVDTELISLCDSVCAHTYKLVKAS